jgi:hypothetical protein
VAKLRRAKGVCEHDDVVHRRRILAASLLAAALAAAPADAAPSASLALDRARDLFTGSAATTREATIVLRDLRAALPRLGHPERAEAERILARPTDGAADPFGNGYTVGAVSSCTVHVCVHWVERTADAPPLADLNGNGRPDWVDTTQGVLEAVWAHEVTALGFRAPKADSSSANFGVDGRLDVYLSDIGDPGLFGYCATDDPAAAVSAQVSTYCVLENDYLEPNFAPLSPLDALRATAAHEFFHSVQFAYDWLEDIWLLEGTATWIEDEVFDAVDDNRRYLRTSPLAHPEIPVDLGERGYEYGSWILWRYLTERLGPGLVSDVFARAETPGVYSLSALTAALGARGLQFRTAFANFGVANRIPAHWYTEGRAYPTPPAAAPYVLTARVPRSPWRSETLAHLSHRYVSYRPGRGVVRKAKLRISLKAPSASRSQAASAIVVLRSGALSVRRVPVGPAGNGSLVVQFGRGVVRRVDVVLTNAGTAYDCWRGTHHSCQGVSLNDRLAFRIRGAVAR